MSPVLVQRQRSQRVVVEANGAAPAGLAALEASQALAHHAIEVLVPQHGDHRLGCQADLLGLRLLAGAGLLAEVQGSRQVLLLAGRIRQQGQQGGQLVEDLREALWL